MVIRNSKRGSGRQERRGVDRRCQTRGLSANLTLPDYVRVARHTGTTSTAAKGSDLPSADILSSVQSSRRFADHFHRETTNTVIVLPHWEKLDNLKFKLL